MKKAAKKTVKAKPAAKTAKKTLPKSKPAAKAVKTAKPAPAKKAAAKAKPATKKAAPAKVKPVAKAVAPARKPVPVKVKPAKPVVPVAPQASHPAPTLPSSGLGTREKPWLLKTPAGFSEFQAYREDDANPPALVVKVGSTVLKYDLRCIQDLHEMLKADGEWMLLGSADEQQPVVEGTVEAWARSPNNPLGGWYGLKSGLRGRFATYVPQVLEVLGLAEVEHFPNNNRMRAK